jgi:hypothetical protein
METNGKYISKGWNILAFHCKLTNTILLVDETYEDQEDVEVDVTILEAGTGD